MYAVVKGVGNFGSRKMMQVARGITNTLWIPPKMCRRLIRYILTNIFFLLTTIESKLFGREERRLRSEINHIRQEFSKSLQRAEKIHEDTFEKVGQIFDTLQDEKVRQKAPTEYARALQEAQELKTSLREIRYEIRSFAQPPRKTRSMKAPPAPPVQVSPKTQGRSVQKWLTHTSLLLSTGMLWYFLKGDFERSVERKLLMCLSLPMLWLYFNSAIQYKASMNSYFLASIIAWFIIGFVCCSILHPHGNQ